MRIAPASGREHARGSDDGSFVVLLRWTGSTFRQAEVRAAVFSLIGSFAEVSTYVRQLSDRATEGTLSFEVVTGILRGESHFEPHGHTLRISVSEIT